MKTKVKVKDLRKGDQLSSGATIISEPCIGYNTPTGKVEIVVAYPNTKIGRQLWGKYTTVTVIR